MSDPKYYDVNYVGNIYMKDLPSIDLETAFLQWTALKHHYEALGYKVKILPGIPGLTDMVFTANQSFPFLNKQNKKCVILSKMRNEQRKDEVKYFKDFYEAAGYKIFELSDKVEYFESMGDALIDYENDRIFGGFGFRTQEIVYDELEKITGLEVIRLKLIDENFYHLDTCMSILSKDEVVICKEGFNEESLKKIYKSFKAIYIVNKDENLKGFLCNCHCPDGKSIIVQNNTATSFKEFAGKFNIIETDTSEFMKSGGSVFCMKMMLW